MAFLNADRVKETSTTTGTGTYSLAGAVAGFRTFVAGIGTTNTCHYVAEDGTDWEVGIGTVTDATPDTLARTLILSSSNAGAAVNWAAGTKNIFCALPAIYGSSGPRTARLVNDHTISSTTATEVTGLQLANLSKGIYVFQYFLIELSATTTVSPMYGIDFSTASGIFKATLRYPSTGTTATTGVADDVSATSGTIHESCTVSAFSTTTPNMGHTGGVAAISTNILVVIEGIIEVTGVIGNLRLWHGSETATLTTVKAGSSVILTQTG